ncbi:MAG TPA: DUF3857 domain-containing transglutaminase family protein [Blastocatellia bacterium]|nr:DUF3857 domain-containing transglutaminase family protein [Blastocatellia bacterium]
MNKTFLSTAGSKPCARFALVAIFLCAAAGQAAAGQSFNIKPQPSWVQTTEIPTLAMQGAGESGSASLLAEQQSRAAASGTERFHRRVEKVVTSAGLDDVSELQIEFEPSYEQLSIHHIRIIRGGRVIDALKPGEIKVIQQENDLYQRIYNGMLSALIFLHDVRVGDLVDYAYTIKGDNPVLRGRYVDFVYLQTGRATAKMSWRLLWPAGRQLNMRARNTEAEPRVRELAGETEYLWEVENLPAFEYDSNTPDWFDPTPTVQLSEFASWDEVTRWALPLYEVPRGPAPALKRQIEEWRAKFEDQESRLLAALRFVQDEVRYLGIEMGRQSHLPTQPSVVFERRFGDCKDKSLLLSTILNSLGIEAHPALVNAQAGHTLDEWQPSPFAFNHVIVQARLGGKTYWFDATATEQRGRLDVRYNPEYARALVMREGSTELVEIERADHRAVTTEVREFYTISSYATPAELEVVTTYRGGDADDMRNQLAQQSISELGKAYLKYYAETDAAIQSDGDLKVDDDEDANTIVTRERYRIPNFWTNGSRTFVADRISGEVTRPAVSRRSQPLAVRFPASLAHIIEIRMPERMSISKDSETISDEAVTYRYSSGQTGKTVKLEYYYTALRDYVPAEKAAKHLEALGKIQRTTGYEISTRNVQPEWGKLWAVVGFGIFIAPLVMGGIVLGVMRVQANRRRSNVPAYFRLPPGASPQSAIHVFNEYDFGRHLMAFRCRCGAPFYRPGSPLHQEGLTFDGRRLTVVRLSCQYCAGFQDVYFAYQQAGPIYPPATGELKGFAAPGNDPSRQG